MLKQSNTKNISKSESQQKEVNFEAKLSVTAWDNFGWKVSHFKSGLTNYENMSFVLMKKFSKIVRPEFKQG